MNRYKEAMKVYSCLEHEDTVGQFTTLDYQKARLTLQELVDRATPKPIVLRNDGFYCPVCGAEIKGRLFYAIYCNECGQALGSDEK